MTADKFTALFCEDIRTEEGNRKSYMGVIPAGIIDLPGFPGLFNSLGVIVIVETEHPRLDGILHLRQGDGDIEIDIPFAVARDMSERQKTGQVIVNVKLVPFPVQKPGILTVDIETKNPYQETFRAGTLLLRTAKPVTPPAGPPDCA